MKTKLILTVLLLGLFSSVKAQVLTVKGAYQNGSVQDLNLMLAPFDDTASSALAKLQGQGIDFEGEVAISKNGFYTLYGGHNGGQLILPLYFPETATTAEITLCLEDNCPMVKADNNNNALSAYNYFTYVNGRAFWMAEEGKWTKDNILPFLQSYITTAESVAREFSCAPMVAEYLKLWAYTSVWKLYGSLPRMLKVKSRDLPFTMADILEDSKELLNSSLAANFPETSYVVLETLPQAELSERLSTLYATYSNKSVCDKVASTIVDGFVRRFDYAGDFEGGLSVLKDVVATYGLSEDYIKDFTKRRASAKGTAFPQGITLIDMDGKPVDFSMFKGSYVYIDLWASWCGPCCREVPHLQALEKELQNPNVKFVSISIDKNEKAWRAKMKMLNMHGHQFLNQDNSLAEALNVRGIPFFMIYDKDGKLYQHNAPRPSHPALQEMLENLK